MDFDFFMRITKELKEAGVEEIGLFYLGESFCSPQLLIEAIRYLKQEIDMPYVFLTTNGSLATPTVVEECMKAGLNSLKFSINACDREQFEKVMQVRGEFFEIALNNLAIAKDIRDSNKYPTKIYASSIKYDGEQLAKMERLLKERVLPYVDEHYWLPLYSMGSVATQREEELGYKPIAGNQGRVGALREPLPCWALFTEGHITSSGKLSACCFDADGRFAMADLNETGFMDGWNSPAFQSLREAHLAKDVSNTVCEGCIAYAS